MKRILLVAIGFLVGYASQAQNLLWGTSYCGGTFNNGTLFQYDPTSLILLKKIDFDSASMGKNPTGSLVKAIDGKLYGLAINGGATNQGVLFQYDPFTSSFTKKFDFDGTNGSKPMGQLLQASDGKLYGMTTIGGVHNKGCLFQYDPVTSTLLKKIDFDGTNGAIPKGSLIEGTDGKLYGMTSAGGSINKGTIFQYDPSSSTITLKFSFGGYASGTEPHGDLLQATDGKLYGMTRLGGTHGKGVLFQYDLNTSSFTKKLDFNGTGKGAEPYGSLIQAVDGKLYGMTEDGGSNNIGVIFQFDPLTSTYTKKFNFSGNDGSKPTGSLLLAANGFYYATTSEGGTNNNGVLFQYDIVSFTYTKKSDFSSAATGQRPVNLIEAPVNSISTSDVNPTNCSGNSMNVAYTVLGTFAPGNIFTAQLSDENGSFTSPVAIGTLASTSSGNISATIPGDAPAGTAYRIRVVSSNPSITGNDNGSNVTIFSTPAQPGAFTTSSASVSNGQNGVVYTVPNDSAVQPTTGPIAVQGLLLTEPAIVSQLIFLLMQQVVS